MAPSSAKRRSARKREAPTRTAAANSSATNSPSRPVKRRKTGARSAAAADSELRQDRSDDETSEDEAVNALAEIADRVTEVLEEAKEHKDLPNVSREHGNDSKVDTDHSISAYAKIAGKTWTYFVVDPTINIGRCPDVKPGPDGVAESHTPDGQQPHIDMAPNKHVSRLHAKVFFNSEDENWHLEVNGRNGVRINETLVRKGQDSALRSGDVLKVDETEMIFVLPGVPANVHQQYMDRLNRAPLSDQNAQAALSHAHPLAQNVQLATYVSPYAAPSANGYHEPSEAGSMVAQGQVTPARGVQPSLAASSAQKATPQRSQAGTIEHDQIDYSDDSMKDIKPPMSYATLIAQAILAGSNEKSSLNGIYEWIKSNFAYYRYLEAGWQNSIRHNLSLNQSFQRVGRDTHEPGKGGLWYIAEDKVEEYRKQGLKMTSRGGARQSSNPASPVPKRSPKKKTPPRKTAPQPHGDASFQAAQRQTSSLAESSAPVPSGSGLHQMSSSQTPSRPTASMMVGLGVQSLPQLSSDASPLPARAPYLSQSGAAAQAGTSPPALSSNLFGGADGDGFPSLFTPAPQRHEPRMTAPSTAKLPSKYLPQSSPAPFWKNIGNTPLMNLSDAASPVKHDPDETRLLGLQSSSPPPPSINGSPTRARPPKPDGSARGTASPTGFAAKFAQPVAADGAAAAAVTEDEEEDDDGDDQLDLMGNFPKIGEAPAKNTAL